MSAAHTSGSARRITTARRCIPSSSTSSASGRSCPISLPDASPSEARAATLRAIVALLADEALADPLLLVVEDLHWADPTTVELLGRIATELPHQAILCVATYRGEFTPPWPATRTLALGPLSTATCKRWSRPAASIPTSREQTACRCSSRSC